MAGKASQAATVRARQLGSDSVLLHYPHHGGVDLRWPQTLAHIAVRSGFPRGLHGLLIVAEASEHHDGKVGVLFPNHGDQRQPVHFGHANIENDRVARIQLEPGFHFGTIEQGGTSLYPQLAQRVTSPDALRILLSIGPTEAMHFQTWSDKAGNAPALTDPTDSSLVFPDLNSSPFGGEDFQTNLIMPEPTKFLSKKLPACSIVRPTATKGAAMGALKFLTEMGLFIGQSPKFFELMRDLAEDADDARRGH